MIIIGGATATGKTGAGIILAKMANGEIISADSMQIYKHMNIGTAKVTAEEKEGIVHHMLDIVEPSEEFSVAEYQKLALEVIADIKSRGKLPIIVGGTGLYINSLIYPLKFGSAIKDENLRETLYKDAEIYGNDFLFQKLIDVDPIAAKIIHKNNVKRVIRAIEVKLLSGQSVACEKDKNQLLTYHKMYAFSTERTELYQKINNRVDILFARGLEEEVNKLVYDYKVNFDMQSMQAIGYKEFKNYFDKSISKEDLLELIKKHSRNYAKRQYTWFRAYNQCVWLENELNEEKCKEIIKDYYDNEPNLEQ